MYIVVKTKDGVANIENHYSNISSVHRHDKIENCIILKEDIDGVAHVMTMHNVVSYECKRINK